MTKHMKLNKTLITILLLLLGMALSAPAMELAYRLKWKFNASVAGDIYARDKGFFKHAGLNVTVKEGGPGINAISELELGRSHFGVASADQVIRAVEKGAKIKVIAQLFQSNPLQWIYRATLPEIRQLSELKGLRIGITYGGNDEAVMNTLLSSAKLTHRDVSIFSVRGDAIPFFKKQADIWPVYRNSQGVKYKDDLSREGEAVRFLEPQKFGVKFVANSVITSTQMLEEHPDVVAAFLKILLLAWQEALNPDNETQILLTLAKWEQSNNPDIQKKQMDATRPLVQPDPSVPIGRIDKAGWQQTEAIMLKEKLIRKSVNILDYLVEVGPATTPWHSCR